MPADKRKEPRYPTNDRVAINLLPLRNQSLRATILNVSRSGLQLEVSEEIAVGTIVEVLTPAKFAAIGEVRYCRPWGTTFRAGVRVDDAILPPSEARRHMTDDELSLYNAGRGLTASQVIHATKHLSNCAACRDRLRVPK